MTYEEALETIAVDRATRKKKRLTEASKRFRDKNKEYYVCVERKRT